MKRTQKNVQIIRLPCRAGRRLGRPMADNGGAGGEGRDVLDEVVPGPGKLREHADAERGEREAIIGVLSRLCSGRRWPDSGSDRPPVVLALAQVLRGREGRRTRLGALVAQGCGLNAQRL